MAKTLWPIYSIVGYDENDKGAYRLCDRVTENQTRIIPILNLKTLKIEWAFLSELRYLDEPDKIKEYLNERRKPTKKTVRRIKKPSVSYRTGSIEKYQRE